MAPELNSLSEEQDRPGIAEFYRGKTIFITGGTGFLGQVLLETLARCCPDIKQIYMHCRAKKGKSINERVIEQFDDPLYDYVKKTNPETLSKITPMAGENLKPNLGLSDEDINTIINEVNIIFHVAATVRFTEKLRQAVPINVCSTRDVVLLARRMTQLAAVVHVSTAYSNCVHKNIDEKFYPPPIDGDKLIDIMAAMDDNMLERITPGLLGDHPNTYTFTKCVAEDLVRKHSAGLPIAIVRPCIVISTYEGGCPGWIDKLNGPVGGQMGICLGIIHAMHGRGDLATTIMPADYVINTMLAAAYDIGTSPKQTPTPTAHGHTPELEELSAVEGNSVKIYNSVNSDNPVTLGQSFRISYEQGLNEPSKHIAWRPFYFMIGNYHLFLIFEWLLHWIPAYIGDAILKLAGRKPMLVNFYVKTSKSMGALDHFLTNEWNFASENTNRLFESLSDADKAMLPFDVRRIEWTKLILDCYMGARKFVLKETLRPARGRQLCLSVAHYAICASVLLALFKLSVSLLSRINC